MAVNPLTDESSWRSVAVACRGCGGNLWHLWAGDVVNDVEFVRLVCANGSCGKRIVRRWLRTAPAFRER